MDILVCVNGTGPRNFSEYERQFRDSHIKKMDRHWGGLSTYMFGPTWDGLATGELAEWAFKQSENSWNWNDSYGSGELRLFLGGFSRGGAAVIQACHRLKTQSIPVHCLILFDAVDRALDITKTNIPDNVSNCFHARRDPGAGSREIFGNCGTVVESGVYYKEAFFYCTHGGVGGVPHDEAGWTGKVHEKTPVKSTARAAAALPFFSPYVAYEVAKNTFTNVTLAQDKQGAKESGKWMNEQVASVGGPVGVFV